MKHGGKQKTNPHGTNTFGHHLGGKTEINTERLKDIGTAAVRGNRPIAVFGNGNTRGRHHKGRGR